MSLVSSWNCISLEMQIRVMKCDLVLSTEPSPCKAGVQARVDSTEFAFCSQTKKGTAAFTSHKSIVSLLYPYCE